MAWSNKVNWKFDWHLLIAVISLLIFGILMVYDASSASALLDFGDKHYFLKEQAKWAILGIAGMGFFAFFDYRHLYKLAPFILAGALVLLVLVFVPGLGIGAYGAHRWIDLRFTVIQPSEISKLALIIYLSAWLTHKEKGRFLAFGILLFIFVGLIILEPDMGTAIILGAVGVIVYYLSGAPIWHLLSVIPVALAGAVVLAVKSSYRLKRVTTFFDPSSDPLGASYHIRQVLIALGSGGLFGVGLGASRQKYSYLPEATTDSIFAIIAEETGFIGALLLLSMFVFVYLRGYKIAMEASDSFGQLMAAGITTWLAIQSLINLGSMVVLIPLTGVPLPFISYGGSALVIEMAGIGILLNIGRKER